MIEHVGEPLSNPIRARVAVAEPKAQRTFTPTQAVLAHSAGVYVYTPEGRELFDCTSGVLVANLGHQPASWLQRIAALMGWNNSELRGSFHKSVPLTAYNAITPLEEQAATRLLDFCHRRPGGQRLHKLLWAASGSEAIQKALWASAARDRSRPIILATRHGFHGKKGLSAAVSGTEDDPERDPRVRFIAFPRHECRDLTLRHSPFDFQPYRDELDKLRAELGSKIGTLITEPYLGGGGSYHPPAAYLQGLQAFCRRHDITFILDEVQSNFGRCGTLFAWEKYGLEPDLIVLGKGLGNGIPVAAVVGRADILDALDYGEASDTWSGNPLSCAAVLATLQEFQSCDILTPLRETSALLESELLKLKNAPQIRNIRGESGGMVWGIEFSDRSAANAFVLHAYQQGVHLLGPLAGTVVRIAPPLIITIEQVRRLGALLRAAAAVS